MNKVERINSALNHQELDRVPCSIWMHFPDVDQDPYKLALRQVEYTKHYDYDFIKLMPFGLYSCADWGPKIKYYGTKYNSPTVIDPFIKSPEDYDKVTILDVTKGHLGKTIELARNVNKLVGGEIPYIQTVFSPATTLRKMTYNKLNDDIKNYPDKVISALNIITEVTIEFVKQHFELDIHGFFFASQLATYEKTTDEIYDRFVRPFDEKVIGVFKNVTKFNVMHIHGVDNMFERILNYETNVINWHDRDCYPNFAQARELTDKCFLGGITSRPEEGKNDFLVTAKPAEIEKHVKESLAMTENRGIIIGPGCVCSPYTSEENLKAVRRAVEV